MLLKLIPSDLVLGYNKLQNDSGSDIQHLLSFLTQSLTRRESRLILQINHLLTYAIVDRKRNQIFLENPYKQQNQKSVHTASELLTAPVKENKDKIREKLRKSSLEGVRWGFSLMISSSGTLTLTSSI
ncbi:hypothetical protein TNCV_1050981 [Trichonephila clavipes]|nr:hypothetical protein TNCV_1050981 [Trichonephila clavipes]